jgi:hypothetical protein
MSEAGVALVGLAVLVGATQWLWTRVVSHVDPQLIPSCSRRRVHRLLIESTHIYVASAVVAAGVLCVEAVVILA